MELFLLSPGPLQVDETEPFLRDIVQVPLVLSSPSETAPPEYITFTRQLEERAQQMDPLLITTSTCS